MSKSKIVTLDSLSLSNILNEDSELIPLMTPEDEEIINREDIPEVLSILPLKEKKDVANIFIFGTILFSFSILFLSFQSIINLKISWLGPITPIGGSFLIFGWILLLYRLIREKA